MEYTKGEWKVEPIIKNTTFGIFTEYHRYELARVFIHNGEQEANANLIASAPDLYEACKEALDIFTQYDATKGVVSGISLKLNEAKRKAEGKDEGGKG